MSFPLTGLEVVDRMTVEGQQPRHIPRPALGQHTLQVLREDLGLAPDAVERLLRTQAAIGGTP